MHDWVAGNLEQAKLKRDEAAKLREMARQISLEVHREALLHNADRLDAQALRLEAEAEKRPDAYPS